MRFTDPRMRYVTLAFAYMLCAACSGDPPPPKRPAEQRTFAKVLPKAPVEKLTDAQGIPLASDEKIAWFEIPKGFTRRDYGESHHVFSAREVAVEGLEAFISVRVIPYGVERGSSSVLFRKAVSVKDPLAAALDITVSRGAVPGDVILTVDEFPPPKAPPLPFKQARAALAEDLKRAE